MADIEGLVQRYRIALRVVSSGSFAEAIVLFRTILRDVLALESTDEARDLADICTEYISATRTGLLASTLRSSAQNDADTARALQVTALFTHFNVQRVHTSLALRSAARACIDVRNIAMAYAFIRRASTIEPIEMPPFLETTQLTDAIAVDYDPQRPFLICSGSFTQIFEQDARVRCDVCRSPYHKQYAGETCKTCEIGLVQHV